MVERDSGGPYAPATNARRAFSVSWACQEVAIEGVGSGGGGEEARDRRVVRVPSIEAVQQLLGSMVSFASLSGREAALAHWVYQYLVDRGLPARLVDRNVIVELPGEYAGELGVLLNTHLDVVPPGEGWRTPPFEPRVSNGNMFGRGANDAKGCATAMILATEMLARSRRAGRVVLALTCDEETGGGGLKSVVDDLAPHSAAIIGEPTFNHAALGMRGVARFRLTVKGRSCHASRPQEGINPIPMLARDLQKITELEDLEEDQVLGSPTITPTLVQAGHVDALNVVPGDAVAILDVRTTRRHTADLLLTRIRERIRFAEIDSYSVELPPRVVDEEAPIVQAARIVTGSHWFSFRGGSDLVHTRCPGIILGPGNATSHQVDEHIPLSMVRDAVALYRDVVLSYFRYAVSPSRDSGG